MNRNADGTLSITGSWPLGMGSYSEPRVLIPQALGWKQEEHVPFQRPSGHLSTGKREHHQATQVPSLPGAPARLSVQQAVGSNGSS